MVKFVKKKAISPVVATALLLVVAVISVVGFQGWFTAFSSSVFTDVEVDTQKSSSQVGVEDLVGDILYINSGDNLSIKSISIGGTDCNINSSFSGLAKIDVSSCIENLTNPAANILVITDEGIYDSYQYLDSVSSSSSGGSGPGPVVCANNTAENFYGGTGIISDPWEICDCNQLQNMNSYLNNYFELVSDIDCSIIANFVPVGGIADDYYDDGQGFNGNLYGNNFTISNLVMDTSLGGAGLFSRTNGDISNLKIINADIKSSTYFTGLLAGVVKGGNIYQVGVSGVVNSSSSKVGGLVGQFGNGEISNSYSLGKVIGDSNVGGLVGQSYIGSAIKFSYANVNVSSESGYQIGGLIGYKYEVLNGSFSVGPVSNSNGYKGSLIGYEYNGVVTNSYWNNHSNNFDYANFNGDLGSVAIQNNEAYFYVGSNAPMNSWTGDWTFSGTGLPKFSWE